MNRIFTLLLGMLIMVTLLSCGRDMKMQSTEAPEIPDVNVRPEHWNTSMKLIDDPVLSNSHKNGQLLILRIENLSNSSITFSDNFGIKVVTLDGQNWVDIQNNFYNAGSHYLPTEESYPLGLVVTALPYVPNLSSAINIRVIIVGNEENKVEELLGAYFDVVLNP